MDYKFMDFQPVWFQSKSRIISPVALEKYSAMTYCRLAGGVLCNM